METRATLLRQIDRYLKRTGMSDHAFSIAISSDGRWTQRLRRGLGVSLTTIEAAEKFMEDHPKGLPVEPKRA